MCVCVCVLQSACADRCVRQRLKESSYIHLHPSASLALQAFLKSEQCLKNAFKKKKREKERVKKGFPTSTSASYTLRGRSLWSGHKAQNMLHMSYRRVSIHPLKRCIRIAVWEIKTFFLKVRSSCFL